MKDLESGGQSSPPILKSFEPKDAGEQNGRSEKDPVQILPEDIEDEVKYWKSSIVGYVAGENPPLHVLEGFVKRIWKADVDEVGMISHSLFIIRFHTEELKDAAINGGFIFFDKKSFIMQVWNEIDNFRKKNIDVVPTWIQLKGLEIKYWGQKSLYKIVEQVGKPIQMDEFTRHRSKLLYPRVLIEVSFNQKFPQNISFMDEFGLEVLLEVHYEWKPILCNNCSGMGHKLEECRHNKQQKQEWRPKKQVVVDEEGFQAVLKGKKVVVQEVSQPSLKNSYDVLVGGKGDDEDPECTDMINKQDDGYELDNIVRVGEPSGSNG